MNAVVGVNAPVKRSSVPISIISETKSMRPAFCVGFVGAVPSIGYVAVVIGPGSIIGGVGGVFLMGVGSVFSTAVVVASVTSVEVAVDVASAVSGVDRMIVEVAVAVIVGSTESFFGNIGSLWKNKIEARDATRSLKVGKRRNESVNKVPIAIITNDVPITDSRDNRYEVSRVSVETVPLPTEISFVLCDDIELLRKRLLKVRKMY